MKETLVRPRVESESFGSVPPAIAPLFGHVVWWPYFCTRCFQQPPERVETKALRNSLSNACSVFVNLESGFWEGFPLEGIRFLLRLLLTTLYKRRRPW